jgi:hypothetical protein
VAHENRDIYGALVKGSFLAAPKKNGSLLRAKEKGGTAQK